MHAGRAADGGGLGRVGGPAAGADRHGGRPAIDVQCKLALLSGIPLSVLVAAGDPEASGLEDIQKGLLRRVVAYAAEIDAYRRWLA